MNNKNCKGCQMHVGNQFCRFLAYNMDGECPCTNCLVKVTCDLDCKQYIMFSSKIAIEEREYTLKN